MLNKNLFEEFANKLGDTIDNSPMKDVEKNIKSILNSTLSRMNLVTREEFEIQQQALIKTREKITSLEARIANLEEQLLEEKGKDLDTSMTPK